VICSCALLSRVKFEELLGPIADLETSQEARRLKRNVRRAALCRAACETEYAAYRLHTRPLHGMPCLPEYACAGGAIHPQGATGIGSAERNC